MMPIVLRQVNRESPPPATAGGAPIDPGVPFDARTARRTTWLCGAGFAAMAAFVATPLLVGPLGFDARWVAGIVGSSLAVYGCSLVAGHLSERPLADGRAQRARPAISGKRRRRSSRGRLGGDVAPALATKTH